LVPADKSASKSNSVAIDAKHTWRFFVLNDAGLLHATLANWALYGMLVKGLNSLRVEKLKHKSEAIRVINSKIATCNGNITDELVGTVLTLASFEASLPQVFCLKKNVHADCNRT
jgi:hypothetical protein